MSGGTDAPRDPAWLSAAVIGLGFVVGAMLFSFTGGFGLLSVGRAWYVPRDVWMEVDAGRFVWNGALGYVYQGTSSYALPLSFIVMAPLSGLVDHLQLLEGSPFPIAYPSAWLIVGPYTLAFGVILLHATRRLAWDLGVRSRLWAVQLVAVLIVLVPCFEWAHFEDVLALAFCLYSARRLLRGDHVRAALYLGVAVSFKQWAVIMLPVVVAAAPSGRRLRTLTGGCVLPAALAGFVLAVDFHDAARSLFSPVNQVSGFQGHGAVFVALFGGKTAAVTRACAAAGAVLAGWRFRTGSTPSRVLAALALIMVLRPLTEPVLYSYYLSPALLLAGATLMVRRGRFSPSDWALPVTAAVWAWPRANPATNGLWWTGELLLLAGLAVQVLHAGGAADFRQFEQAGRPVKVGRSRPILRAMSRATRVGDTTWTR